MNSKQGDSLPGTQESGRPALAGLPSRQDTAGLPVRDEVRVPPSDSAMTRRTAMKLLSATALLAAGGVGCTRKPERRIIRLAETPEYQKPGLPLHYASTWTDGHHPYGLMIKAVDGRPVKVEGLPEHPLNRGASNAQMQASLLSLYDPERLRSPLREGGETTWDEVDRTVLGLKPVQRPIL